MLVSIGVAALAVARLAGWIELEVEPAWWVFAVLLLVVAIDLSRLVVSYRTARRHSSAALFSNAVHFGSDLLSTLAVMGGLVAARAGFPEGDSIAALFVAVLVVTAAARLIRRNVDVLMDRAPADAVQAAHDAIARLDPPVPFVAYASARQAVAPSPMSSSASPPRPPWGRATPQPTASRTRCSGCFPAAMSWSTWSRPRRRRRSARACGRRP